MDMVKKRKYITEPEVRYWTVQMAGAIKYMHAKGIIHRDLKMGNIFLDKNMNVKIGDFGLAALLMTGKEMQAARRTTLCGTPNYIAPEILSKDKSGHDHAVDIWSLGIIMYATLPSHFNQVLIIIASPCSRESLLSNHQPQMRSIAEPENLSMIGRSLIHQRTSSLRKLKSWWRNCSKLLRRDQIPIGLYSMNSLPVVGCRWLKK